MRYKNSFFAGAILLIALTGCSELSTYRYWHQYAMVAPVVSYDKAYEDNTIKIRFTIGQKKIFFDLKNISDKEISILWKKAKFINVEGKEFAVANASTAFSQKRFSPPDQTLKAGEKFRETVIPVKNIKKLERWTWYVYPLFDLEDESAYDDKGATFGLYLPMKTDGKTIDYKFRFRVEAVLKNEHV